MPRVIVFFLATVRAPQLWLWSFCIANDVFMGQEGISIVELHDSRCWSPRVSLSSAEFCWHAASSLLPPESRRPLSWIRRPNTVTGNNSIWRSNVIRYFNSNLRPEISSPRSVYSHHPRPLIIQYPIRRLSKGWMLVQRSILNVPPQLQIRFTPCGQAGEVPPPSFIRCQYSKRYFVREAFGSRTECFDTVVSVIGSFLPFFLFYVFTIYTLILLVIPSIDSDRSRCSGASPNKFHQWHKPQTCQSLSMRLGQWRRHRRHQRTNMFPVAQLDLPLFRSVNLTDSDALMYKTIGTVNNTRRGFDLNRYDLGSSGAYDP